MSYSSKVLDYFKKITEIPRESGHEGPMTAYLQAFAAEHNLACRTDAIGNVVITREASKGKEDVPVLVLQRIWSVKKTPAFSTTLPKTQSNMSSRTDG